MKKLSNEDRLKIYKWAMRHIKKGTDCGFCYLIGQAYDKLKYDSDEYHCQSYTEPDLINYPELRKRLPDKKPKFGWFYWMPTAEGWVERKKVLQEAIDELTPKKK